MKRTYEISSFDIVTMMQRRERRLIFQQQRRLARSAFRARILNIFKLRKFRS